MIKFFPCYFWLARHGCDLSQINFIPAIEFKISISGWNPVEESYFVFRWGIPQNFPVNLYEAWEQKDWQYAKRYPELRKPSDFTDEQLDEIPF